MWRKLIDTPAAWRALKPHALSELVEFGVGIDMKALAAHMTAHGYDASERIVLYEGKVLDGRHRLAAAIEAGVIPTFAEFEGDADEARAYVAKKALRQHLNESQRAMLAERLATMGHGGDRKSQDSQLTILKTTIEEAAKTMKVSKKAVQRARKVAKHGSKKLNKAVIAGAVSVSDAAKIADAPKPAQDQALKAVTAGVATTLAEAVSGYKSVTVQLSAAEHGALTVKAGKSGQLPSEFVRDLIMGEIVVFKAKPAVKKLCPSCKRAGPRPLCRACYQLN